MNHGFKPPLLLAALLSAIFPLAAGASDRSEHAKKMPVIANLEQATELVRELLDSDDSRLRIAPASCYTLDVSTLTDGTYLARVGKTAEICSPSLQVSPPLSIEINAATGAVTLAARHGHPAEPYLFQIEDNPDMPPDLNQWRLSGTTKQLADTDQCLLDFLTPAFERVNAYSFGLRAGKDSRTMTVSYYVDAYGGGTPLKDDTRPAIALYADGDILATYQATLKPLPDRGQGRPLATNNVAFEVVLTERDALQFLHALSRTSRITPILDQQPQNNLVLSGGGFEREFAPDINSKVAAAFRRCLDVIWKPDATMPKQHGRP